MPYYSWHFHRHIHNQHDLPLIFLQKADYLHERFFSSTTFYLYNIAEKNFLVFFKLIFSPVVIASKAATIYTCLPDEDWLEPHWPCLSNVLLNRYLNYSEQIVPIHDVMFFEQLDHEQMIDMQPRHVYIWNQIHWEYEEG